MSTERINIQVVNGNEGVAHPAAVLIPYEKWLQLKKASPTEGIINASSDEENGLTHRKETEIQL